MCTYAALAAHPFAVGSSPTWYTAPALPPETLVCTTCVIWASDIVCVQVELL